MIKPGKILARLRLYYFPQSEEEALRRAFARRQPATPVGSPAIAVQCCADMLYFGVFGEIVAALRRRMPLHADQYVYRSLRIGESISWRGFLWAQLLENGLSDRRWERTYFAYCDRVAVRSARLLSPLAELRIWLQAWRLWRVPRSKDAFAALAVRGIPIGDLVIDSFIRFKPVPEFDGADRYVFRILRQALRDIEKAHVYFRVRKPRMFLTSYTSYVQHGIPARVAIALGIPVFSFGNYQQLCKPLSPEDQTHLAEHWNYPTRFRDLAPAEQQWRRTNAGHMLAGRMDGEIDNAIGYMRHSPYVAGSAPIPEVKGAVIVYLPDFYDSIHVYRWTVFRDYWEWICFTIDTLTEASIRFLIKEHPNAYGDSQMVSARLRARYPDVCFVPAGITTAQLAAAGIAAGVSPRGTVLSELAYLGVPVIAAGDHPHAEFDLSPVPRTVEEYRQRLLAARSLPRDPALMRQRACEFYAMHNLPSDPEETALRDKWLELRAMTMTEKTVADAGAPKLASEFEALGREPAFRKLIEAWSSLLLPQQRAGHAPSGLSQPQSVSTLN